MEIAENVIDSLDLPDNHHEQAVKEFICGLHVSLEELRDAKGIAESYELHLVERTPLKELPLFIGHLKTNTATTRLEERLKG